MVTNIQITTNLCVMEYVYCRMLNLSNGNCRGASSLFGIIFLALAEPCFLYSYERSFKVLNIEEGKFWLHLKKIKLFKIEGSFAGNEYLNRNNTFTIIHIKLPGD